MAMASFIEFADKEKCSRVTNFVDGYGWFVPTTNHPSVWDVIRGSNTCSVIIHPVLSTKSVLKKDDNIQPMMITKTPVAAINGRPMMNLESVNYEKNLYEILGDNKDQQQQRSLLQIKANQNGSGSSSPYHQDKKQFQAQFRRQQQGKWRKIVSDPSPTSSSSSGTSTKNGRKYQHAYYEFEHGYNNADEWGRGLSSCPIRDADATTFSLENHVPLNELKPNNFRKNRRGKYWKPFDDENI